MWAIDTHDCNVPTIRTRRTLWINSLRTTTARSCTRDTVQHPDGNFVSNRSCRAEGSNG